MAVASWMLRNRNLRSNRFNRIVRHENAEDVVKVDLKRDPQENAKEILAEICKPDGLTEGRRANYLNAFIKVLLQIDSNLSRIVYSVEEILYCLRIALVNESSLVRAAALKAIRHVLTSEEDVEYFNKLHFPYFVARSLDLVPKNDLERIQALRLMRKVLLLSASVFDISMARSLVTLANCGIDDKDRLLRACIACLSELGVLNPELFIASGGVAAITRNLVECQTPRIAESLCGVLLLLLDKPISRNHAAIDLRCVAAPYCDFHYRHGWMDKNRDERELRFTCSRLALLSVLRSWPGILHFCSPNNSLGLKAIVDILYLNQLEVRKAVLDLLYELLGLPQPEWTDELSVALGAIDPAEPQVAWRLNEGFVAAEGRSILPHLAKTTPNITDIHIALLLYCFFESGLLGALAEVIATSDTFISVRATVLLGELLRLIQFILPPECCNITPALPNLIDYATRKNQALGAVTALQQLHKLLKRRPASASLYLDYILQSGSFLKRSRTVEHKKCKLGHSKSKLQQLVSSDGEHVIRDTGVLLNKDTFTWNWNIIKIILKGDCDFNLDCSQSSHLMFLKQLVEFYLPSNNRYSHMDLISSKNTQGYTIVGIELVQCLLRLEDSNSTKLLLDLFKDISNHIAAITSSKSAHDCLFSPQHMSNTQCQNYFLFIGRLGSIKAGVDILNSIKIFTQLHDLATTTKHDCYVKLIVSSLDYQEPGPARDLLTSVLKCSVESYRLYATQFLHVLLRAGLPQFFNWGIKLLTTQLEDKSRTVCLTALAALHEACEVPSCLEYLIKLQPDLLHLGEKGVLLLIRFLSIPSGFNMLKKNEFVINEIRRWDEFLNFRYVRIVEGEVADILTLHQRGEDGRYDKRLSSLKVTSRKDLFMPPHIYGQLAKHSEGFVVLLEHGSVEKYIQCVENGLCETEEDILNLKVALWALGHVGASTKGSELLNSKGILACMVRFAQHCVVYSIRATAFFTLSLVATTRFGADCLFKLGWICTRHDRYNRWPVVEEENWNEELTDEHLCPVPVGSDSERASSDHAFAGDFFTSIPDADSTTTEEDFPCGITNVPCLATQQKSLTLPCNQNPTSLHHKRSLSESKTFDVLKIQERKPHDKVEFKIGPDVPHRYRDNSVTESTTSGVSSCESALGRTYQNEKLHTLSPIPSSSSLMTLKTPGMRMRRHSESARRISLQSSTTPSDRSTISPVGSISGKLSYQDMMGYAVVRALQSSRMNPYQIFTEDEMEDMFAPETLLSCVQHKPQEITLEVQTPTNFNDFRSKNFRKNYLDNMSLTSLSSIQKFGTKEDLKNKGQCYMGICLPRVLTDLFPDNQVISRRLSFTEEKNLLLEDNMSQLESETTWYDLEKEKELCRKRFAQHDSKSCINCSKKQLEKNPPDEGQPANTETRYEILQQAERLANPVWGKQARQALANQRQKYPHLFRDICLYSEVLKLMSENTYRLGPRRMLHELFMCIDYEAFHLELNHILNKTRHGSAQNTPEPNKILSNSKNDKTSYLILANEQRKIELSNINKTTVIASQTNRRIVCGFNINKPSGSEGDNLSPIRIEPRSPPLSSVKEENCTSTENLNTDNSAAIGKTNANNSEADNVTTERRNTFSSESELPKTSLPTIKTLDSLNLSYSQNKFPIRNRSKSDPKSVIK